MIQNVINRLANNSFRMKGWAVVLVSALLVLLAREDKLQSACIAFIPVVVFWGLDGYFLWQERLFRDLYNRVRTVDEDLIDFSMDTGASRQTLTGAVFSCTLIPFYVALASLIAASMLIH